MCGVRVKLGGFLMAGIGIWYCVEPALFPIMNIVGASLNISQGMAIASYMFIALGGFSIICFFCGCIGTLRLNSNCLEAVSTQQLLIPNRTIQVTTHLYINLLGLHNLI
jgi:hypothetical protein